MLIVNKNKLELAFFMGFREALNQFFFELKRDIISLWLHKAALLYFIRHPISSIRKIQQKCFRFLSMAAVSNVDKKTVFFDIPWKLTKYYVLVRILILFLGIHMQTSHIEVSMHLMDLELMRNDFWVSLWNMHSQPPLFNVLTWVVVKFSPFEQYWIPALFVFVVLGIVLMLALYNIQLKLGVPAYWAAGVSFLFSISANSLYYGSYFLYAFPVTVLLVVAVFYLIKFLEDPCFKYSSYFFVCLLLVCLFHSIFHLLFYVTGVLLLFLFIGKYRWKLLSGCIFPLFLLVAWYGKTYMQVGQFAASTWGGWTIAHIMLYYPTSPEEKDGFVKSGVITPNGHVQPFSVVNKYAENLWQKPETGISILDDVMRSDGTPNLHHISAADISKEAGENALNMLKNHPEVYLKGSQAALYLFMLSPSEWFYTRSKIVTSYWDYIWSAITTGKLGWTAKSQSQILRERWREDHDMPTYIWDYIAYNGWYNFPWFTPFVLLSLVGYGFCVACYKSYKKDPKALAYWAMLYIIGYVTTTSILLDVGENQRYRYYMSPLLAVFFGILSLKIYKKVVLRGQEN